MFISEGIEIRGGRKLASTEKTDYNWEVQSSGRMNSSWFNHLQRPLKSKEIDRNISVDVAIVGAGIAGITTAYCLSRFGMSVTVLEDGYIGSGETGRTTAHITHALDDRYYNIEKNHGPEGARLAAESHTAAIDFIEHAVKKEAINCEFERLDGFLFLDTTDTKLSLEKELKAVQKAGLSTVKIIEESPIRSTDISPCLCFPNQAQFQPLKYLMGIVDCILDDKVQVFTKTHAQEIKKENSETTIRTSSGYRVTAQNIVLATNAPIVDDVSKIYDKQFAYRTYVIATKIQKNSVPLALYWDTGNQKSQDKVKPYHYVRIQRTENKNYDLLIVGGEDQKTGSKLTKREYESKFRKLELWMKKIFSVKASLVYNWSGQVMEPVDGVAFIGQNPGNDKNIYIATGDSGNGITHGTIAGIIVSDLIRGKKNSWADLYNPAREIK